MAEKIIKGMFISIGEDGLIETPSTLNEKTGELSVCDVDGEFQYNNREEQYFESEDGKIHYKVCRICHEFIMKSKIIEVEDVKLSDDNEICMNGCND